jgi:hypothetical protein
MGIMLIPRMQTAPRATDRGDRDPRKKLKVNQFCESVGSRVKLFGQW